MTPIEQIRFYEANRQECPFSADHYQFNDRCPFCESIFGLIYWAYAGDEAGVRFHLRNVVGYYERRTGRVLKGYSGERL